MCVYIYICVCVCIYLYIYIYIYIYTLQVTRYPIVATLVRGIRVPFSKGCEENKISYYCRKV